jgi:hypothetical protein
MVTRLTRQTIECEKIFSSYSSEEGLQLALSVTRIRLVCVPYINPFFSVYNFCIFHHLYITDTHSLSTSRPSLLPLSSTRLHNALPSDRRPCLHCVGQKCVESGKSFIVVGF